MSKIFGTAATNEKEAIGTFFLKILANFLGVGQIFCDHHYINPVLRTNGSSDFDDLGIIVSTIKDKNENHLQEKLANNLPIESKFKPLSIPNESEGILNHLFFLMSLTVLNCIHPASFLSVT